MTASDSFLKKKLNHTENSESFHAFCLPAILTFWMPICPLVDPFPKVSAKTTEETVEEYSQLIFSHYLMILSRQLVAIVVLLEKLVQVWDISKQQSCRKLAKCNILHVHTAKSKLVH